MKRVAGLTLPIPDQMKKLKRDWVQKSIEGYFQMRSSFGYSSNAQMLWEHFGGDLNSMVGAVESRHDRQHGGQINLN